MWARDTQGVDICGSRMWNSGIQSVDISDSRMWNSGKRGVILVATGCETVERRERNSGIQGVD